MISREEFDKFIKKAERYCNRGIFLKTHEYSICDLAKDLFKINNDYLYILMKAIDKYNEPMLTDSEKDYLKAFIKPFKDRINYIVKDGNNELEYLMIVVNSIADYMITETISFPYFIKGSKYVNMELNKKYTLKELGLED